MEDALRKDPVVPPTGTVAVDPVRPRIGISDVTSRVNDAEERDKLVVQTAIRNAVSKAIIHMTGRAPEEATVRDTEFENGIWLLFQKEFVPRVDFSGGKKS